MANVKTYLSNILSAVYGKDVRSAIHDSIEAINTQVETITASENSRVSAEKTRISQENARIAAEKTRVSQESARSTAEAARQKAEKNRADSMNSMNTSVNGKISQMNAALAKQIAVDTTLSKTGQAADAKIVGDKLKTIGTSDIQTLTVTAPSDKVTVNAANSNLKKYGKLCILTFSASVKENIVSDGDLPLCISPVSADGNAIGIAWHIGLAGATKSYPIMISETKVSAVILETVTYPFELSGSVVFFCKS